MNMSLSLIADPKEYTGFSHAKITFKGLIQIAGLKKDCNVEYRFIRSDGAKSRKFSFIAKAPAHNQIVETTWSLGLSQFAGWEAIEILSPNNAESNKAFFTIRRSNVFNPFQTLSLKRNVVRNVLVIIQDPQTLDSSNNPIPIPTISDFQSLMTDIQSYFSENSKNLFGLNIAGILGPYRLQFPFAHYDRIDPGDTDNDGWENQYHERYPEAIRSAAGSNFNFAGFDTNNDGILSPDELAILIMTPGTYARGFRRAAVVTEHPWQQLTINGLTFTEVIDMYTSTPLMTNDTKGGIAHELAHLLLGHADLYFEPPGFNSPDGYQPFRAGLYSLMDQDDGFFHLDPFCKLKCGWVSAKIILEAGSYIIKDVETSHEIHVLGNDSRGIREYFILENRSTLVQSRDSGLPDSGLGIWHIIEDASIYGNLPVPNGVPAADWNLIPSSDWGRRAIRFIRADASRPLKDGNALWHGPQNGNVDLNWADGTSAFHIRSISVAGTTMNYNLVI